MLVPPESWSAVLVMMRSKSNHTTAINMTTYVGLEIEMSEQYWYWV